MRSTDSLLLLELPKINAKPASKWTPSAVFCAERSPDETTMVFRSWLAQLQQLWSNLRYFPVFLVMILS